MLWRALDALEDLRGVWPPEDAVSLDTEDVYERLAGFGLDYGPVFQGLGSVWRRDGEVFAEVSLPEEEHARSGSFAVHPALLDAALHAAVLALLRMGGIAPVMVVVCVCRSRGGVCGLVLGVLLRCVCVLRACSGSRRCWWRWWWFVVGSG